MTRPALLFVDDEVDLADVYRQFLGKHFDIDVASSVEEGIAKAAERLYAVIIVDMHYEQRDASGGKRQDPEGGLRLIRYLAETGHPARVIVLTAHGNVQNFRKGHREGIYDYIEKGKPDTSDSVLAAALEASKIPERLTLELSRENVEALDRLKATMHTDRVGMVREGLRLLNWAVDEWNQEREVASIKDTRIRRYPKLVGQAAEI